MGSWGAFLACRAPADPRSVWPEAEVWGEPAAGWTMVVTALEERTDLAGALAALPGPALAAAVYDGDYAHVLGADGGAVRWEAYLDETSAAEDGAPVPAVPAADDTALHERIEAWAAGYGGPPVPREELCRVLAAEHVFVDDTLHELARLLGVLSPASAPPHGGERLECAIEVRFPADVWAERRDALDERLEDLAEVFNAEVLEYPPEPDGQTLVLDLYSPADPAEAMRQIAGRLRELDPPPAAALRAGPDDPWTPLADL